MTFTSKLTQVVPEASPATPLLVCVLPSSPSSLKVNGPRRDGATAHAFSVAVPPQVGVQPAVQVREAPKPRTQIGSRRHCPPA